MPIVSVIVPNYNHSKFLNQRIDSILNQTYQDFELIILDDCSTDSSKAIIENYSSHPKITHIVYNETNSGSTFKQWEKGIALAKGAYIWLAESDDIAEPTFLEITVDKLINNSNIGISYCQSVKIDLHGTLLEDMRIWTDDLHKTKWNSDYINKGIDECLDIMIYKNTIPNASAVLFRKSIFEKLGNIDTSYKVIGDWKIWFDMLLLSDVAFSSHTLNRFRFHPQNVRHTKEHLMDVEKGKLLDHFRESIREKQLELPTSFRYNYLFNKLIHPQQFITKANNLFTIFFNDVKLFAYTPIFIIKHLFYLIKMKKINKIP